MAEVKARGIELLKVAEDKEKTADRQKLDETKKAAAEARKLAEAMKHAVLAGRAAYRAGRMPKKLYATASSPLEETLIRSVSVSPSGRDSVLSARIENSSVGLPFHAAA